MSDASIQPRDLPTQAASRLHGTKLQDQMNPKTMASNPFKEHQVAKEGAPHGIKARLIGHDDPLIGGQVRSIAAFFLNDQTTGPSKGFMVRITYGDYTRILCIYGPIYRFIASYGKGHV